MVPIYFHGSNSRLFHIASHISKPLRMALLVHEALRMFGQTVQVEIGTPIHWPELARRGGRADLTTFLYKQVQKLAQP